MLLSQKTFTKCLDNQNVTLMSYYIIKAVFNGEVGEAGF